VGRGCVEVVKNDCQTFSRRRLFRAILAIMFQSGFLLEARATECTRYPGYTSSLFAYGTLDFLSQLEKSDTLAGLGAPTLEKMPSTFFPPYYLLLKYPPLVEPAAAAQAIRALPGALAISQKGTLCFASLPPLPKKRVLEFFNTNLQHYFYSADTAEIEMIERGGVGSGWQKTGESFGVFSEDSFACYETSYVARFYAPSQNSHFFTIDRSECGGLINPSSGWKPEGIAFTALPSRSNLCEHLNSVGEPKTYVPLYRLYNNRFAFDDSNHRFTTSQSTADTMVAQKWASEGVAMCVQP
jgi:Repeat of unknown function (DUF5648)